MVVKAELQSHLQALRNYFLLASGEFFHNFLVEAKDMMLLPVREATVHADITAAFDQSASKSTVQHDKFFSFVSIKWSKGPVKVSSFSSNTIHFKRIQTFFSGANAHTEIWNALAGILIILLITRDVPKNLLVSILLLLCSELDHNRKKQDSTHPSI